MTKASEYLTLVRTTERPVSCEALKMVDKCTVIKNEVVAHCVDNCVSFYDEEYGDNRYCRYLR